jgi:hypothetical protein
MKNFIRRDLTGQAPCFMRSGDGMHPVQFTAQNTTASQKLFLATHQDTCRIYELYFSYLRYLANGV